ncbi:nascent polypeptide-associated complex subunit alpha, muscle-specific form-like isoform X2 [Hemicordylus capensis]|uniref:nascent polypeptide-associated complex subunit alpha, muscle-specific form-like isoform X2 n=1 Tax=Hemicordylus capensis TaxID=884348 RepID=UPI002302F9BD|nr:nascent polypeptide-associated complex subunit alpha, muscle-specific form-like isoform X2 [Hemicordylus capensis]
MASWKGYLCEDACRPVWHPLSSSADPGKDLFIQQQVPCLKRKKQKKHHTPLITPLEGAKDMSSTYTEERLLSEDRSLLLTLQTLDRNIHYLAWQMQRLSHSTRRSASSSSAESVTSICSWTRTSAGGGSSPSRPRTPPSPAPGSPAEAAPRRPAAPPATRPQKAAHQGPPAHHKADVGLCQKRQQPRRGATAQRGCLSPPAPSSHPPAPQGTRARCPGGSSSRLGFLDYKNQELLDWHIQRKHRHKEAAPSSCLAAAAPPCPEPKALVCSVRSPPGGTPLPWVSQQPPAGQKSRSHTPPPAALQGRCSPPKPRPAPSSPEPLACLPLAASEDSLLAPLLVCKNESPSCAQGGPPEGKTGGVAPSKELAQILSLLGRSKSPVRPATPKEREKGACSSSSGRPSTPKEGRCSAGRAGSPKAKGEPLEAASVLPDRKVRRLSWADAMPEAQRPCGGAREQPGAGHCQPKFLEPSFMCQNQLELPCLAAAAQAELPPQGCPPPAKAPRAGAPKAQCLAHSIVHSLDLEQARQQLHLVLAKGLEKRGSRPSVEYPVCLLCGRCTPYCPHHPRRRHSPCLLVYPRLSVQAGEVRMNLGFLLKIKRSEAEEWGLAQGLPLPEARQGKEPPPRKERSRSRSRRRRARGRAAAGHHQSPALEQPRQQRPIEGEEPRSRGRRRSRGRGGVRNKRPATPAPAAAAAATSPRAPKTKPPYTHPGSPPPPTSAKRAGEGKPLLGKQASSLLKRVLSCLKHVWAKVRGAKEKEGATTASPSKGRGQPPPAAAPPPASPAPGGLKKKVSILLKRQDSSPLEVTTMPGTSQQPGTPAPGSKKGSPKARRRPTLHFTEAEPLWGPKKEDGRRKKPASPGTPKKPPRPPSPAWLKKSPSWQSSRRGSKSKGFD